MLKSNIKRVKVKVMLASARVLIGSNQHLLKNNLLSNSKVCKTEVNVQSALMIGVKSHFFI